MNKFGNDIQCSKMKDTFRIGCHLFSFLVGGVMFAILLGAYGINSQPEKKNISEIHSLYQLLSLPLEQLNKTDIGLMNLLCAAGLKGSENLDIDVCLVKLDFWADRVKKDTEKRIAEY